jgi:hypothetical protein
MNKEFIKWLKAQTYYSVEDMNNDWGRKLGGGWKVINKPYDVNLNFCWGEIIKIKQIIDESGIY